MVERLKKRSMRIGIHRRLCSGLTVTVQYNHHCLQHKQTGLIAHLFCMPALLASSSFFNNNNNSTDSQSQENIDRKRSRDATDSSSPDGEQPSSSSNDIPPAKRIKTL
ncbi:hypothetical protein D3C80_1815580 [compost metagenome]